MAWNVSSVSQALLLCVWNTSQMYLIFSEQTFWVSGTKQLGEPISPSYFGNLVLQDQMIPKGIPGQFRDQCGGLDARPCG